MPKALVDAGFLSISDLWPPWCVALDAGEIASVAFAARTAERSTAVGVYTFPGFRGRGLAAAVTAKWSSLPSLAGRALFYSTTADNTASRHVIARLRLPAIGVGLRIS
jgi:predicted GNAT family acetyltransferase